MIFHLASVEFKPEVADEQIAALIELIAELPTHIGVVHSMNVGWAVSSGGERLHKMALASTFESRADLSTYLTHSKHVVVGGLVKELSSAVWGSDFEV